MDPAYANDAAPSPAAAAADDDDDDDDDDDGDVADGDNEQTAIVSIKEYVDELEAQELVSSFSPLLVTHQGMQPFF
jgi:hypothetical protein